MITSTIQKHKLRILALSLFALKLNSHVLAESTANRDSGCTVLDLILRNYVFIEIAATTHVLELQSSQSPSVFYADLGLGNGFQIKVKKMYLWTHGPQPTAEDKARIVTLIEKVMETNPIYIGPIRSGIDLDSRAIFNWLAQTKGYQTEDGELISFNHIRGKPIISEDKWSETVIRERYALQDVQLNEVILQKVESILPDNIEAYGVYIDYWIDESSLFHSD